MNKHLDFTGAAVRGKVHISGSKSESNRMLILQKLFPGIALHNLSNSDDTKFLAKALASEEQVVDIHHAGTAMRFLTAYFSANEVAAGDDREVVLTGSQRMQERPIGILVDALRMLGAEISYEGKEGYPPLRIKGKKLLKNRVRILGNVSSQYLSALLLIATVLEHGLVMELEGEVTSVPYLKMTLQMLNDLGVSHLWEGNTITVSPLTTLKTKDVTIESDWSSASYFYSLVALADEARVELSAFKQDSLQGDSALIEIYKHFGVQTRFEDHTMILTKGKAKPGPLELDMVGCPDLAQTVAVTCFGLGIGCDLSGLHTLKIKETDRLVALHAELSKLGADISVTDKSLHLRPSGKIKPGVAIDTYQDHRMAMAFAPLALKVPITINEAEVVSKSFTDFWKDFEGVMQP